MSCKFCANGVNTAEGLKTVKLDREIFTTPGTRLKLKRISEDYICPLGCVTNPLTEEATQNAIRNSERHAICRRNEWL